MNESLINKIDQIEKKIDEEQMFFIKIKSRLIQQINYYEILLYNKNYQEQPTSNKNFIVPFGSYDFEIVREKAKQWSVFLNAPIEECCW